MLLELFCVGALLAGPATGGSPKKPEARALVLRADKILLGDGTTLEPGAILNLRVAAVNRAPMRAPVRYCPAVALFHYWPAVVARAC